MNYWKIILATLVIFGAGVVTGGLLVRHSSQTSISPKRIQRMTPAPSVAGTRLEFLRRAQRELGLTPEQRQKIDLILKESQERTRKLMQPIEGDLRQELQQARDRFRETLTVEQQTKFDELVKRPQRMRDPREQRDGREKAREDSKRDGK